MSSTASYSPLAEEGHHTDETQPYYLLVSIAFKGGGKWKIFAWILFMMILDIAIPTATFFVMKQFLPDIWALIVAAIPSLIKMAYSAIYKRKLEVMGIMFIFAFAFSTAIALLTGNARLILLEKSLITLVMGVVFLITAIPIQIKREGKADFKMKPMIYLFSNTLIPLGSVTVGDSNIPEPKSEWMFREIAYVERMFRYLTIYWGSFFVSEFVAKILMIRSSMSLDALVFWSNSIFLPALLIVILIELIWFKLQLKHMKRAINNWFLINGASIVQTEGLDVKIYKDDDDFVMSPVGNLSEES